VPSSAFVKHSSARLTLLRYSFNTLATTKDKVNTLTLKKLNR